MSNAGRFEEVGPPPAVLYNCSPDRKAERPAAHLEPFRGILQVDGYAGFEPLAARGNIALAACWTHTRLITHPPAFHQTSLVNEIRYCASWTRLLKYLRQAPPAGATMIPVESMARGVFRQKDTRRPQQDPQVRGTQGRSCP